MHELSIAHSLVESAVDAAEKAGARRVTRVHLRLGALSGVVRNALEFGYEITTQGTLLEGSERSSTAVALSPVLALVIDQATLQHLLEHNATIASRVVKQLVRRLRDAEHQLEVTMHTDIQSKVVRALLEHARRARGHGSNAATFFISPMELAAQVGLDVDTLKRNVQKLREGQYVRIVDERLEIPSIEGLRKYFGLLGQRDELAAEVPDAR